MNYYYNEWGMFLFNLFGEIFYFISFSIVFFLIFIIVLLNSNFTIRVRIIILTIFLGVFVAFIYKPYDRGRIINATLQLGYKVVNQVNDYANQHEQLPRSLAELKLTQDEKSYITEYFKYNVYQNDNRYLDGECMMKAKGEYAIIKLYFSFTHPVYYYYDPLNCSFKEKRDD